MSTENAVSLKLPQFWSSQPNIWFAQAEAQFHLRKVTDDTTKYYYVVSALDQDTALRLSDVLAAPPPGGKYNALKARLLSTFGLDRRERAARLLRMSGLGDRKPSELMDEMLGLLDGHPPCFLFEQIFLEQLPTDIQLQLLKEDFSDPRKVAILADSLCLAKRAGAPSISGLKKGRNTKQQPNDQLQLCFYHSKFGEKALKCQPPCAYSGNAAAGRQ